MNTPETKESCGLGTKRGDRLCTSFVAFRGATMGLSDVHFVLCTLKKWTFHLKYYRYSTVVSKPSCHTHHRRCANRLKIDSKFYYVLILIRIGDWRAVFSLGFVRYGQCSMWESRFKSSNTSSWVWICGMQLMVRFGFEPLREQCSDSYLWVA